MDIRVVGPDGLRESTGVPIASTEFLWVDIAEWDEVSELRLRDEFAITEAQLEELQTLSIIPRNTEVDGAVSLAIHSLDPLGHLLELSALIKRDLVVTTHAHFAANVETMHLNREVVEVAAAIANDEVRPQTPGELVALLHGRVVASLEAALEKIAKRSGAADRHIRDEVKTESERELDDLFDIRRDLVTTTNRLRQTGHVLPAADRACATLGIDDSHPFEDLEEHVSRLVRLAEGEQDFFQAVLDLYEQRMNARMNFAMERLALIAAIILPVNAVAGILGMNTIVTGHTNVAQTGLLLGLMTAMVVAMLIWTRRRGWW